MTAKKNDNTREKFTEGKRNKENEIKHGKKQYGTEGRDEIVKKRKRNIFLLQIDDFGNDSEIENYIEVEESVLVKELETLAKSKSHSAPRAKREGGEREVWKLVNRTYKEGECIVIRKERVYVSPSEDKEEIEEVGRIEKKPEIKREKAKRKLTGIFEILQYY